MLRLSGLLVVVVLACAPRVTPHRPIPGAPPTHDVDARLEAVLESQNLSGACDALRAGDGSEATRLRCGKWLFFYETFGTTGVPEGLLELGQKHFAGYYGRGFENFGFIADPASPAGLPIGLAPGRRSQVAFTCAACHFGRLPDGSYAVGVGNTRLQYGRFIASLGAPLLLSFDAREPQVAPALRAELAVHVERAQQQPGYGFEAAKLGTALLFSTGTSPLTLDVQERHLALPPGVLDFLTPPLLDDGVWAPSRILSLWDLPGASARAEAGMPHEMLAWNGGVPTLDDFMGGFITLGFGESWPRERLAPLLEYVRRLRSPPSRQPDDAEGARLFVERGCAACHSGPSGEGKRVFTFAETGTNAAYADIYGPRADGSACCGLRSGSAALTRGVKAPRLKGVYAATRLLHDGSVASLEELFCLTPRTSPGHEETCRGLSDDEKRSLIRFLRAW